MAMSTEFFPLVPGSPFPSNELVMDQLVKARQRQNELRQQLSEYVTFHHYIFVERT